jgi:hypothetical protein
MPRVARSCRNDCVADDLLRLQILASTMALVLAIVTGHGVEEVLLDADPAWPSASARVDAAFRLQRVLRPYRRNGQSRQWICY